MRCENCGVEMAKAWKFCPGCGFRFAGRKDLFNTVFGNIFRMSRQMRELDQVMEKRMDVGLTPVMRPSASGFSIKITQTNREKPEVSIRTFGGHQRIEQQVGMRSTATREAPGLQIIGEHRTTEEPRTTVTQKGALVEIDLPGVVSQKDIHIADLERSVEVKAVAGDRAFFKIITKPEHARFVAGRLEKGRLMLEFSR